MLRCVARLVAQHAPLACRAHPVADSARFGPRAENLRAGSVLKPLQSAPCAPAACAAVRVAHA
eukprot:10749184-Alexandrium_andersonii.AAC.1